MVNAFTSPLGDIFIFSGMMIKMRNSSELAGVLAHEIAHVRADHFAKQQRKAALSNIPGLMAAILSGGDSRVIASAIAVAQSYQLHWSREMELESDRLALQYLRKTGFDPEGLLGGPGGDRAGRAADTDRRPGASHDAPGHVGQNRFNGIRPRDVSGKAVYDPDRRSGLGSPAGGSSRHHREAGSSKREWSGPALPSGKGRVNPSLGLVLSRQERYHEAKEKFLHGRRRRTGKLPATIADLGASLFLLGEFGEARESLQRSLVLDRDGGSSYTHYYLGKIYERR